MSSVGVDLAEAAAEVSDALQSEALDSAVRAASVERSLRLAAESAAATAQQVLPPRVSVPRMCLLFRNWFEADDLQQLKNFVSVTTGKICNCLAIITSSICFPQARCVSDSGWLFRISFRFSWLAPANVVCCAAPMSSMSWGLIVYISKLQRQSAVSTLL